MIDPVALRQWIGSLASDNPIRVAFEAGNNVLAAELAKLITIPANITRLVPLGDFSDWLTSTPTMIGEQPSFIRYKLEAIQENEQTPDLVKRLIRTVFGQERNPHVSVINPATAAGILNLLQQYQLVSAEDVASFTDLSTIKTQPRWPGITADSFELARKVGG